MCWNNLIFNNTPATIQEYKTIFKHEFTSLLWQAKKKYFPRIQEWLQSLA
jgi:hypothetical protein